MRGEVLRLGADRSVRAREEELIGDEFVEHIHVTCKLRRPELGLERDDLGIRCADEHRIHPGDAPFHQRTDFRIPSVTSTPSPTLLATPDATRPYSTSVASVSLRMSRSWVRAAATTWSGPSMVNAIRSETDSPISRR